MRRNLALLMAASLATVCLATASAGATEIGTEVVAAVLFGDINRDGLTNDEDLRLLERRLRGDSSLRDSSERALSESDFDVNRDDLVDWRDAMELQHIVEFVSQGGEFPPRIPSVLLGDVNGDQQVDITDLLRLSQFIAGSQGVEVVAPAADINEDGEITIADLLEFARQVSGARASSCD